MTVKAKLPQPTRAALARSDALKAIIHNTITQHKAPIPFSQFMALALYHPQWGYYQAPDFDLGRAGDFITAPIVSPLFAQCFAEVVYSLQQEQRLSTILEIGAGTGHFARDILAALSQRKALPDCYFIYEISPVLRQKQQAFLQPTITSFGQKIIWLESLPTEFNGIVIANEVLDAQPINCFAITDSGNIEERAVNFANNEFIWQHHTAPSALLTALQPLVDQYALQPGYQSEINLSLQPFLEKLLNGIDKGVILLADYGYGQREYYHPQRSFGTLTCFYQHHRHADPFYLPGLQDITAHVDFTRVIDIAADLGAELLGFTNQANFLLDCGLLDLANHAEQGLNPAQQFELHQAIKTLTLPTEMGERIKIMGLAKNIPCSIPGFRLQDRRRDL